MSKQASRVGVIFGGPSPEHDVSVLTGLQALRGLSGAGFAEVHALYWSKNGEFFEVPALLEASAFFEGTPKQAQPLELLIRMDGGFVARAGVFNRRAERLSCDAYVICCHGGPGEDGALQGALDLAGIAYAGPSALGAGLAMDKLASGALVSDLGLAHLPRVLLDDALESCAFPPPYIVKPRFGGSSIGIDVVADLATAKARLSANVHLRRGAVLEPYRPDLFDVQIAVRSWPSLELSASERPLRQQEDGAILGYADKYVGGEGMLAAPRVVPADIPEELEKELRIMARRVASAFGVRGVARIDFLCDGSSVFVNEVNAIPGSLSRYLFADAHAEKPCDFEALLRGMLDEALARPAAVFSSAGADGSVLHDAGSIAAKLA